MRPIVHPEVADVPVEMILHAMSDPVRVAIFADITRQDCSQNCSTFLNVGDRLIPKSTLSQHFRILREAGLIRSERQGVEVRNTSRCLEVDALYPGMLAAILQAHKSQLETHAKAAKAGARKSGKLQGER